MKKITVCFLVVVGSFVTACASSTSNLALKSAISLNVAESAVVVSDVKRSPLAVRWSASVADKTYKCAADDMVRNVSCVE